MYKGKWDLKILIYSAVVDCLSKIDCLKQLLLQFIKLTDAHLLLKNESRVLHPLLGQPCCNHSAFFQ